MTNRLRALFRDSAPLMAVVLIVAVGAWVTSELYDMADGSRPTSPMGASIADGLDELYLRGEPVARGLSVPLSGYGGALAILALGCLAWSLSDTVSVLRSRVRGLGDATAVARSVVHRMASAVRAEPSASVWGQVYDAHRWEPVPFATVTLYAEHQPLAVAVSDVRGRYGFSLSRAQLVARGVAASLVVHKDGFSYAHDKTHQPHALLFSGERLLLAGSDTAGLLHIPLQRHTDEHERALKPSRTAMVALVAAVLIAPSALIIAPGVWSAALVAGVVLAALLRGTVSGL